MKTYKFFSAGKWCESSDYFDDINPANGEIFARIFQPTETNIDSTVRSATDATKAWQNTGPTTRERVLIKAADILERRRNEIIHLLIQESGCVFGTAWYQVEYSIDSMRSAAGECRRLFGETIPSDVPGLLSITKKIPVGVIIGIAPFNVPLALSSNKIDKAIAAGNSFILKPSEHTPISGLILAETYEEAGLPPGVLNVLPGDGSIGNKLVQHPDVNMILFTGSTKTGKAIAQAAAKDLKKVHLEMGGKSPLIVLADADINYAVNTACFSIFNHQGQVCMASSRIIIEEALYDDFCKRLVKKATSLKVGEPGDMETIIGPLIRAEQCPFIKKQIEEACSKGARLICGGNYSKAYFEATVLADVTPEMRIFDEESFGPVVSCIKAKNSEHALQLANKSSYGLSSAVITNNLEKAMQFADGLEAGMVHINGSTIQCEPNVPFGGVKNSGFGREGGHYSIDDVTQPKWITISQEKMQYPF
ncbi:MAG: aldehyde dehydrogenase family protein [Gammaproteobacteria bacterium]|jgi:vanillin dehydrogenase|nr:aldehyde dehydrogenase family protein [Gammaproteobacteria bacterium]